MASTTASPSSGSTLSFNNIRGMGSRDAGQFRVMGELFGWKSRNPNTAVNRRVVQYDTSKVSSAEWYKTTPKESQLLIRLKAGETIRFDGFRDADFDVLSKHFETKTSMRLRRVKLATKGWHWGEYELKDSDFVFKVGENTAFGIHIPHIHTVNNRSKNDISLEFFPDDDDGSTGAGQEGSDDRLLEVRFALPATTGEEEDPTTVLRELLLQKSGAHAASKDAICMLSDVKVPVPSARFDITMMKTSMKLHGKSNDFIVPFKTITRMFLLPGPEPSSVSFVLSLDTPLRKGQTRHPNVVIQFDEKKHINITLNLDEEEMKKIQERHPTFEKEMSGREYDVVTRIFKALVEKPVTVPGDFKNSSNQSCFRCSYKASSGHLYPLNKMLIFITKPVIIQRYEDVISVEFGRTSGSQTKMFEFSVVVKGGAEYEFSSVDRHEYQPLVDFLQQKGIRIRNLAQQAAAAAEKTFLDEDLPSDDESDEDFQTNSSASESSDDDDEEEEEEEKEGKEKEKKGKKHKRSSSSGGSPAKKRKTLKPNSESASPSVSASSPSAAASVSLSTPSAKSQKESSQS